LATPVGKCENERFLILPPVTRDVKMDAMAQVRPYRGIEAAERLAQRRRQLLNAGLQLLGAKEQDPAELTVRAICRQAGLGVRYFYESFTDKDDLVAAVFDWVIADIAATTQASMAAAPPNEQNRAGMANIVRTIEGDARVGRLLFSSQLSNAVVVRKRAESGALMAMLSGQHVGSALRVRENERIKATAHFVVGGVTQTISAWLSGAVELGPDKLVDQLTAILDALADPTLYKG
jgi:AcrR family transcriptional regulator